MIKNNFLQHVSVSSSVGFLESSTSSNSVYCNVKHRHETDNARKFTINNDSGTVQSHICDKCGKCFATKRYLVKHGDSHVDKKLECEICGKVLKQPLTLKKHLLTHQSKKLVCSICGKKYQSYVGWISHVALHKDTKTEFICSICQRDCRSKDYLRLHMKNKHSCDPHSDYNCEECKKSFKSKLSLRNHSALRHGKTEGMKLYKCMICGKKSLNKYCHQKHLLKHNHSIPLTCEICCSTFKHQTSLLSHKKIVHSEGENFPCSTCGKSFKTKSYLNTHMSNVHVISDREKCRFCKKIFKTTVTLRNHIQACHTPERRKQHVCEYCCRSFLAPKDLNRHMTIHTGLKNFKCEICDKAFSRLDNLNVHKKMHYKVKSKPTDVQYEIS